MSTTMVYAKVSIVGFHHWPAAPPSVSFLAKPHRHVFNFYCWTEVSHDDRDQEFFILQRQIRDYLYSRFGTEAGECDFGTSSCETLGRILLHHFPLFSIVEVNEDDENGAVVTR